MSTTCSHAAPARTNARAAATGSPPNASTGTGPDDVEAPSRPPTTSIAGSTVKGTVER